MPAHAESWSLLSALNGSCSQLATCHVPRLRVERLSRPAPLLRTHRYFAGATLAGRVMVVSSCNSAQFPASGDAVVTVLSTANEAQPVDSATGWKYVGSDDGEWCITRCVEDMAAAAQRSTAMLRQYYFPAAEGCSSCSPAAVLVLRVPLPEVVCARRRDCECRPGLRCRLLWQPPVQALHHADCQHMVGLALATCLSHRHAPCTPTAAHLAAVARPQLEHPCWPRRYFIAASAYNINSATPASYTLQAALQAVPSPSPPLQPPSPRPPPPRPPPPRPPPPPPPALGTLANPHIVSSLPFQAPAINVRGLPADVHACRRGQTLAHHTSGCGLLPAWLNSMGPACPPARLRSPPATACLALPRQPEPAFAHSSRIASSA